jgi:ADP-heptose:LPS heptosyltransferase
MSTSGPNSIFILRPDNLGDLVLFSGGLRHLRRHWPEAHITLCVRQFGEELFAHCPHVDRILRYDDLRTVLCNQGHLPWMPRFRGRDRLGAWIRRLAPDWNRRQYRCDIAILPLLSPVPRYHQIMQRLPAQTRIGICGNSTNQTKDEDLASRRGYSRQWDASALPWNFPELDANRLFLEFLGVDMCGQDFSPEFWTTARDQDQARALIPAAPGLITLGLAPGVSSSPYKKLPATWFAEALGQLSTVKLRVVLLGSPAEVLEGHAVGRLLALQARPPELLDLTGETTICEMVECLRRCDVVLSQDSAALHLATALHKPVVGIMAGAQFGRFYPWGDPALARVVNKPMECYGCNWHCIYDTLRCIQEIPPAAATIELQSLIAGLQPA